MIHPNGHDRGNIIVQEPPINETMPSAAAPPATTVQPVDVATRAKQRAKQQLRQNRFVIIGAGAIVVALMIFVVTSMPRRSAIQKAKHDVATAKDTAPSSPPASADKSIFPVTDSGRPQAKETHQGFLNEQDLDKTAMRQHSAYAAHAGASNAPGTLGAIPPFGGEQQTWQAPPYQPGAVANGNADAPDSGKAERDAMEKSSLVYVRNVSSTQTGSQEHRALLESPQEIGLGLGTGSRLRARLESAASTAVRTPVLAVIEYNYERDGEIVVPAGAKAVGQIQEADRSGYLRIQFESLLMPDGGTVPMQAAATDLNFGPLKGKVEGKNTGKNVLVRSLSGIGEVGALLVGRGNLGQPLSESDLLRERVSNNIGEASDEQISRMAVTQHIVVTVSAGTPIYVVLEQAQKSNATVVTHGTVNSAKTEELRQLLQLQRELNQAKTSEQ
jgi:hypothetical protein